MKRLRKPDQAEFEARFAKAAEDVAAVAEAIEAYNEHVHGLFEQMQEQAAAFWDDQVQAKLDAARESAGAVDDFRAEIYGALNDVFNERSERWQGSESGDLFQEWMSMWDEDIDPEFPEGPADLVAPEDTEVPVELQISEYPASVDEV